MLTYEDCLGLSELTPQEIEVIASHERLPAIAALQLGDYFCRSPGGKQIIKKMMLEEAAAACRRGNTRVAGKLGVILHHFMQDRCDRHGSAEPISEICVGGALKREQVDAFLTAMLRHFGIDRAPAAERFAPEMQVAEMCCGTCSETDRCRRFLESDIKTAPDFCPNAPLLDELSRSMRAADRIHDRGSDLQHEVGTSR